jgi:hypothetical protein
MKTTCAGLLAFVTTASSFTKPRTDAATDTAT